MSMSVWMRSQSDGGMSMCMLYDGDTGNFIEVEGGRTRKSVENLCTKALTEEQRAGVKTVCTRVGCSTSYTLWVMVTPCRQSVHMVVLS